MIEFIATATNGSGNVASFGSGETGGRTQKAGAGRNARKNASPAMVRSLRSRINRQGVSGNSKAARARRELLADIDRNTKSNGNITRGALASIASDLADL